MANNSGKRKELIDDINWLCEALNMTTPVGFPDDMSDEEMIKWLGIWDEFDPYPYDDDEDEENPDRYILSDYDTPVCNHTIGLTKENIGYSVGVLTDKTPFEAELYEYETEDGKNVDIGIILPILADRISKDSKEEDEKVVGFSYEVQAKYAGVLNLGMVDEGEEEDDDLIHLYVEYLEANELIHFTSNTWNGSVHYCTDSRGMDLAYVAICLTIHNEVNAYTNLNFRDFSIRKKKASKFTLVKW